MLQLGEPDLLYVSFRHQPATVFALMCIRDHQVLLTDEVFLHDGSDRLRLLCVGVRVVSSGKEFVDMLDNLL